MLDSALAELAHAHGVATDYGDWRGGGVEVSADTVVAVLAALGVDAHGPDAVQRALADTRDDSWRRLLPPYVIARAGSGVRVAVHVPHGDPVEVSIELEDGGQRPAEQLMVWVDPRSVGGRLVGEATFAVPSDLPPGYHRLVARSKAADATEPTEASAPLIVVPDSLPLPAGRSVGFMLQLYAVRSRASWGLGDFRDLADLASSTGRQLHAGFVLVNPLHAAQPVPPMEPSPYFPASRRFVNPVYLRVEDVVEVGALPAADVTAAAERLRARLATDDRIDRDTVWAAKRAVLERAFRAPWQPQRRAAFDSYLAGQGEALRDFATWCALAEIHGLPWQHWPEGLRDPSGPLVTQFRAGHGELVAFYAWLQWCCEQQLAAAQRAAAAAGMPIGVLHDLAVGANPQGADAWSWQQVLAPGVTLGAPADMYNQLGQRWNLPPWHPSRLAERGFAPYRDLVRAALRDAGGVRVDHIIGLFRQWWVPDGVRAAAGTYVRLDHEALVGILLLEAARAGAVVIGEDLGVVEPWVREYLRGRGVLGTSVLWFEHDDAGGPRPPEQWRPACLATVTTHDLPPTAGYLAGEHVELRAELGLLTRSIDEERAADEAARLRFLQALVDAGTLRPEVLARLTSPPPDLTPRRARFAALVEPYLEEIVDAAYAYLARTPALLVGIYLPDVVGDRRPVNQPGTVDEYPNWRVPVSDGDGRPVWLEDVVGSAHAVVLAQLAQLDLSAKGSATVASSAGR